MVKGGSSKTFAVWLWGTCEASCEEKKGERELIPFGKLKVQNISDQCLHVCVCVCVRASGGELCFGRFCFNDHYCDSVTEAGG